MNHAPEPEVRFQLRIRSCVPHVTYGLLLLVLGTYLLQLALGASDDPGNLILLGGRIGSETLTTDPWRLVMSTFLHADLLHLLFNLLGLWLLGRLVEAVCGPGATAIVAIVTALSGGVLSSLAEPQTIAVGASSMVYGLLGTSVVVSLRLGRQVPGPTMPRLTLILLIFAAVLIGLSAYNPGIDGAAHVGGGVWGLLLGTGIPIRLSTSIPTWTKPDTVAVGIATVLIGGSVVWMLADRDDSAAMVDRIRSDMALRTANHRAQNLISQYEQQLRIRRENWAKRGMCPCLSCASPTKTSSFPPLRCDLIVRTLANESHKLTSYPSGSAVSEYHRARNLAMLRHLGSAYGFAHRGMLGPTLTALRDAQRLAARVYHQQPRTGSGL